MVIKEFLQIHASPNKGIIFIGEYFPAQTSESHCSCTQPKKIPCNCGHPACTCNVNHPFLPKPNCCGIPGCSCAQKNQNLRYNRPEVEEVNRYESQDPKADIEILYGFDVKVDPNWTPKKSACGGCGYCADCQKGYRTKRAIKKGNEKKLKRFGISKSLKKKRSKKIVKRDINYEFKDQDLGAEAPSDLSLPEIIQYMPETLLPNYEKGQCIYGCKSKRYALDEVSPEKPYHKGVHEFSVNPSNYRNAEEPPQTEQLHLTQEDTYFDPTGLHYQLRAAEEENHQQTKFPPHNPFTQHSPQLPFTLADPIVGAPQYPQQPSHYTDPRIDHLVKQIIYSHPDFIEASNHGLPGPALTPPEERQEEEISDFFTKLVRGRVGQMMGDQPHLQFGHPQHYHHHHNHERYGRNIGVDEEDEKNIFGV